MVALHEYWWLMGTMATLMLTCMHTHQASSVTHTRPAASHPRPSTPAYGCNHSHTGSGVGVVGLTLSMLQMTKARLVMSTVL